MKKNALQRIMRFILKYIWIFCTALILMEISSTIYSAYLLMQQSSQGVLQSVGGEISGRVDGVLRLLTGLAKDDRFSDISQPIFDRALLTRPYKESYDLFMIALTDENFYVASSNMDVPDPEPFSLAHRDYLQELYATGKYQITDAFPAGADNTTMNYTVAVPIVKDGQTKGSIFGSIYFDDIAEIIMRSTCDKSRSFYLLGEDHQIMADGKHEPYGKTLEEHAQTAWAINTTYEKISKSWCNGITTNYWEWGKDGLCYITSMQIAPTKWTLVYQVLFSSVLATLLPVLLLKTFFYLILCSWIAIFGRKYLRRQLTEIGHLWDKVAAMQSELFQSEKMDYNEFLDITAQGLTDQLTGLATRTVLFNQMQQFVWENNSFCAIFFLDLDDLKYLNDAYGHEAGDCALVRFSQILKKYEQEYKGIAVRYGGDEFILLIKEITEENLHTFAGNLCQELRTVIKVKNHEIPIHGSIGISLYPKHGEKAEELISKADHALYMAKQGGKNQYAIYDSETDDTDSH